MINEESLFVSGELTALCFREYRTFITVHECTSSVDTAFSAFTSSLDSLLSAVPALEAECQAFAASTKETQHERRKAALVLDHHDKLLDLLEVPVLLDTCVRNGYYHEALELGDHARGMADRYGDVPIVRDVEREVERGLMTMLVQLLSLLREPVKLPALVKTVGFLRRMDVLSEDELQVAFLASREHNFRASLVGIERERADPVRYVRRYVDLFRENVYDVVSQFTTIFLDGAPPPTSSSPSSSTSEPSPPAILVTFAHQALLALLALLSTHIPRIEDSSALSSLLTQLNYCAASFARLGLDFRSLIIEPFERAVLLSAEKSMREAEAGLEATLKEAMKVGGKPPTTWMSPPESLHTVLDLNFPSPPPTSAAAWNPPPVHLPPSYLTHFPSLSLLSNAHTNTLNSLRLLAPLSQFPALVAAQRQSLRRSAASILAYVSQASSEFAAFAAPVSANNSSLGHGHGVPSSPVVPSTPTTPGGRPSHRRNPSLSLAPSEKDARETKLVLLAYARAFDEGLVPFLRRGLVEGVYGAELGSLAQVDARAAASSEEAEDGLREWARALRAELSPPEAAPVTVDDVASTLR